ncbi:MAG: hypothetical protein IJZ35_08265 [Clostridia bacterium]|nr:hypothetical protein [Clostridia bacterium]
MDVEFLYFMLFFPVLGVFEILAVVFSLLFMHYSAKYRNQKLSTGWYVCGVLFGLWTVIVYLIKRKDFPGPHTKKCFQCGNSFPDSLDECPNCNIALPEINPDEKRKQKKLSRGFGIAFIITYIIIIIAGISFGVLLSDNMYDYIEYLDEDDRISVDGVFYDKMGNSYDDEDSVMLYDEDGHTYLYTVETDDALDYEKSYYIRDDGKKYVSYDCYVTEDGWFYCDKAFILELYSVDTSTMTQEELDAYYDELLEDEWEYKYYDYPYVDREGNLYYAAYEASWNENGELITAENDIEV